MGFYWLSLSRRVANFFFYFWDSHAFFFGFKFSFFFSLGFRQVFAFFERFAKGQSVFF